MSNQFLGEIRIFAGNFAPRGWALCNGQIMSIAQNTALFSLLGTNYGGNGTTTFALPNFQGRAPMHQGDGPGLTPRVIGEEVGEELVTLTSVESGSHTHTFGCGAGSKGENNTAAGQILTDEKAGTTNIYATASDTQMHPATLTPVGGGQPHENRQPFLVLNFIIATAGIFPARN